MGRPRKTERHDDDETEIEAREDRDSPEQQLDDFENPMFADKPEWAGHIPPEEWPEGVAFRWVSYEVTGAPHNQNWSVKTAAGWQPVPRGKYKKLDKRFPFIPLPGAGNSTGGAITFGSLCLCERPLRMNVRDRKKQEKDTQDSLRTIDTYVEGGNANFPRRDFGSTPVQYERGVRPAQFKE